MTSRELPDRPAKHGGCKTNIDTDCRLAGAAKFRKGAQDNRAELDLRQFLKPAMDAMRALCRNRFERFGTAGHACTITPIPLPEMARRERAGALDPCFAAAA